jgi:peptidyl-prolyl cis-trans isomerase SurA
MKKSKIFVVSLINIIFLNNIIAQDPIVMTINKRPVKKSEFEAVYKKNNVKEVPSSSKSVKEYVDLFSLFKSKVFEAESLGLDTLNSFKTELLGYRRQLAAPYLTDKNTTENLLLETYDRMKYEVRASHILVRLEETALPKDTLEAWTRINLIRNAVMGKFPTPVEVLNYDKLLKNSTEISKFLKGKDSSVYKVKVNAIKKLSEYAKSSSDLFQSIAPKTSDDPSALDNKGDLNYFTALDMVYPFESAAYNTKVGEISPIVRTRFGYHILKISDKRESRGEIFVAHIMCRVLKEANDQEKVNAKTKIDEIYAKIKAGQNFEDLARQFSDDKQSNERGGQLQPFKGGRLPKDFEDAAFNIKSDNEISEPILSQYGWHIIKRIELKTLPPFSEIKNDIKSKINRDSRSQMGRVALIEKVKKENNFKENIKNKDEFNKIMDSTYLKATWKAERAAKFGNKEIFNLGGKSYTQNDFAKFLEAQMTFRSPTDVIEIMKGIYKTWVEENVISFEDALLEKKYVEFANLYREYRDGILLFDLTDQKVWSKAVKDTLGLKSFYETNKNKYLWEERAEVTTYKCLNEKVAKDLRKLFKDGKSEKEIVQILNISSQLNVSSENVTYLKGENTNVDANWIKGIAPKNFTDAKEKKVLVLIINNILTKSPKTLAECRGSATSDFQNFLDTEWLNYLKDKYKVELNQEVLSTIK